MNEDGVAQINKDINRTYFRTKTKDFPKILYNILMSFVYSENKINYVQGINSITAFIYDLLEIEEDTFHMLICLFNYTQLRDIYADEEFHHLKILFYSMERILYLYLPKIYSKFKDQNLQINFFTSAYFITLFTILYPHLPDNDIYFIIRVWDEFILEGWKSFCSTWLAILKFCEDDILKDKGDILNYLTNKIKQCELFKKETGITIFQYAMKLKIEAAEKMLVYTDYSPSDISNYFAFASHSHFINIFKKHTGLTPNEYRKLHYQKYFEREANII